MQHSLPKENWIGAQYNIYIYIYIRRPLGKGERAWELWCQMRSNGASNLWIRMVWARNLLGSRSAKGFGSPFSYIVRGRRFAWFRHESCCCSAVSQAVRQRLWTLVFDVWRFIAVRQRFWKLIQLLMRFVGNILALFVVAVSHGFGTNPAAVRLFRKRLAKGFGR